MINLKFKLFVLKDFSTPLAPALISVAPPSRPEAASTAATAFVEMRLHFALTE